MTSTGRWAVVVAGGPGAVMVPEPLPAGAFVVAADSGLERAADLGLPVDVVVGDFDSVSAATLQAAADRGVRVERHPREKDQTDLELALSVACDSGADRMMVLAGDGGRFDHTLANALLLASDRFAGVSITAVMGSARVAVVRTSVELHGDIGELVSLLAVDGVARGIVTEGLRYALRGEDLEPGTSRGVSNEFVAVRASVSLESGVLLAVQPGAAQPGAVPPGAVRPGAVPPGAGPPA